MFGCALVDELALILSESNDEHGVIISCDLYEINMLDGVDLLDVFLSLQQFIIASILFPLLWSCWPQLDDRFDLDDHLLCDHEN